MYDKKYKWHKIKTLFIASQLDINVKDIAMIVKKMWENI